MFMKYGVFRKYGVFLLAGLAGAAAGGWGDAAGAMMVFRPLAAAAEGLRALSLSGAAGDAAAWALYALLSLLPLLLLLPRRRKWSAAGCLAAAASAYSFFYWYAMVNPASVLPEALRGLEGFEDVYRVMLTMMLYALLFGAAAFRLIAQDGRERVLSRLRNALYAVMLFVCLAGACAPVLMIRESLPSGGADIAYAAVCAVCAVGVSFAVLRTLICARELLDGMRGGWFLDGNEALANALYRRARMLLGVVILCGIAECGLSLLLVGRASSVNAVSEPPIFELLLALSLLLLSRFIGDGIRMRRENESFV